MKPILGYWDLRGIVEPIRYLLRYKKVDFLDKRYVHGTDKWLKEKFSLGLDFPNLPYYMENNLKLSQSLAIIRHLGAKYELDGKTNQQKLRIYVAEQQSRDFRMSLRTIAYDPHCEEKKKEFLENISGSFREWERFVGNRKFIAGDDLSYVDFMVYENLDYYRLFHATILEDYPILKAYHSRVKNLPEMQEYLKSPNYKRWPIFGPTAKFGGGGKEPKHI
ncbi:glutathione S-transferase-like [Argiope bruennichi]|uniref:glutathione transferase n=1 Tax=Argiope bruennichi TaxID=94029 RepID=A0A8T0EQG7_ARGBR|nr:glutathione S-transferase-like [Argiope bruennichi]KAF8777977.1 Glutathione S-transferase like protein [Argiope bruennichi]